MPVITGTDAADLLTGTPGDDVIDGLGGDDVIRGGGGADTLNGGAGNDTFVWSGGVTTIDGGAGFDTLDLGAYNMHAFFFTQSLSLRLGSGGAIEMWASIYQRGGGYTEALLGQAVDVERILLGIGVSVSLAAVTTDLTILAQGDADTITTGSGDDIIDSGGGDDLLRPGGGDNRIWAGAGEDVVHLDYAWSASTLSVQNGVVHVISGGAHNRLTGVERIVFSDRTIDLTGDGVVVPDNARVEGGFANDVLTGSFRADNIFGRSGSDSLDGLAGDDWIFGGAGSDRLRGGAGDDRLDGGEGADAALYGGLRRQYAITADTVSDTLGEAGVDTLARLEELRFVDGTLVRDVSDSNTLRAIRLYDAAFDRAPDPGGLAALIERLDQGQNLSFIAGTFLYSAEFQSRYGALNDRQFVEHLYRACLGREGDPAGIAAWTERLANTVRSEVLLAFSESAEHRALLGEPPSGSMWVADAEALTIARLYDATFDRLPDAGGLATWTNNLRAGMPILEIAAAFASAPEFQQRYGTVTNQQFIEQMYRFCLNREPDAGGLQTWLDRLNSGTSRAEMLLIFSESAEHISLTAPQWLGGIRYFGAPASPTVDDVKSGADEALVLPMLHDDGIGGDDGAAGYDLGLKAVDAFVLPATPDDHGPLVRPDRDADGRMGGLDDLAFSPGARSLWDLTGPGHALTLSADGQDHGRPAPWSQPPGPDHWLQ